MATEIALRTISKEAAADLSATPYRFVTINASGQVAIAGAGAKADGVLQNDPAAQGRAAAVAIGGQTKIVLGGTVAAGAQVASDATGRAVTAATGNHILGTCTEGGTVGVMGSILFEPNGVAA